MIIKFVIKFLPTCLPFGLTVAALDAFGRIPGLKHANMLFKKVMHTILVYKQVQMIVAVNSVL